MPEFTPCAESRYQVRPGDMLTDVARKLGVLPASLLELNPHAGSDGVLEEGQVLDVPSQARMDLCGALVAISDRGDEPGMYLFSAGTGESRPVKAERCSWGSAPTLSPDGGRVAFQGDDGRLYVADLRNGASVALGEPLSGFAKPKWSPGGDLVLAECGGTATLADSQSGAIVDAFSGSLADWLGDGSYVVFVDGKDIKQRDIWSGSTWIAGDRAGTVWGLAGSSDGAHVAYVASGEDSLVLRTLDIFTQESSEMRVGPRVWPWSLKWSPDGRNIAYLLSRGEIDGAHCVDLVSIEQKTLSVDGLDSGGENTTPEPFAGIATVMTDPRYSGLAWSPDSRACALSARSPRLLTYTVFACELSGRVHRITGTGNCILPDWGSVLAK